MKFGIREICDVVLKAKSKQKIGNKTFYKNEPVIYFDTLKTSTLEGAATTVYAQGGRGNARLVAWEGERTLTFTMEDALISPAGFMILSGAGLVESSSTQKINVHTTETTDRIAALGEGTVTGLEIYLSEKPYYVAGEDSIYVMLLDEGEWNSEPYIAVADTENVYVENVDENGNITYTASKDETIAPEDSFYKITVQSRDGYAVDSRIAEATARNAAVFVDYYVTKTGAGEVQQIEITADKFGGNYYLEASTLFKNTAGVDMPAEFVIPNCKIQSNFTFTMASSGDPSTFTFTMDAFPDYTRFDNKKKVLAAIQVISTEGTDGDEKRAATSHDYSV